MTNDVAAVIVGGGVAGLSTAWYLQQSGVEYVLLEQSNRWGGKILTEHVDGYGDRPFVVEGGPDSFITQKPWGEALSRELGLGERLIGVTEALRQVYVLHRGRPTPLPDGIMLIVPTRFWPFVLSRLISARGKLRMGLEWFMPARRDDADETLADFVRRRLGGEALDKIAEPLLSGIYNAEAERQSLLATFPRFRELEKEYGSLTRGMIAAQRARKSAPSPQRRASGMFITPAGGVEELIHALVNRLTGDLRLHSTALAVEPLARGFVVHLADGSSLRAHEVVFATPAFSAARLLHSTVPDAAFLLDGIRYVSTGVVSLAYRAADAPNPLKGYGLVIPTSERRPINAITLSSLKFEQRAPTGYLLLRVFFGGSRSPQSMMLSDDDLSKTVGEELDRLLGIDAAPLFHRIHRWERANPQYDVGHLERVAAIEAQLPPGLHLTGSPYRGVGIPDCVKQAQQTAQRIAQRLSPLTP